MNDRTREINIAIQIGLILLLIQLQVKTLVFYTLAEDVEHVVLPGVLSIYYKNHFCDYLDLRKTTEAWCVVVQTIQYLYALCVVLINKDKVKVVGKIMLAVIAQLLVGANVIMGYDPENSLMAQFIVTCYSWLFVENIGLIEKASQKIRAGLIIGLCMSLVGSIGNQVEQNLRGHVVDYMIAFPKQGMELSNYVFNLEDIYCVFGRYICIVILMYLMIHNLGNKPQEEKTLMKIDRL